MSTSPLTNWGNYPRIEARWFTPSEAQGTAALLQQADAEALIARGNGRCYGDSATAGQVLSSLRLNKLLAFDAEQGLLTAEAGVLLSDILQVLLPRGWFPAVTPGTKYVTLGGALAADIHGKNHHCEGSLYHQTLWLDLLLADGSLRRCSRTEHPALFEATIGGMGLTGVILRACIRLRRVESAYIRFASDRARHLEEILELFAAHAGATYSMAWIDCLAQGRQLGRSILMRGEHATAAEAPAARPLRLAPRPCLRIPFYFPAWVLNRLSIAAFNAQMYHRHPRGTHSALRDYDSFFYPLDAILHWNRMYGRRGFTQYQFVLPLESSREGLRAILGAIAASGQGSFLAVLKLFGPGRSGGPQISFPMEGYTLALDFPLRPGLFPLLDRIDRMVLDYGGRIYLAKDVRMPAEVYWASYPQAEAFRTLLAELPKGATFASLQSTRLQIPPA